MRINDGTRIKVGRVTKRFLMLAYKGIMDEDGTLTSEDNMHFTDAMSRDVTGRKNIFNAPQGTIVINSDADRVTAGRLVDIVSKHCTDLRAMSETGYRSAGQITRMLNRVIEAI